MSEGQELAELQAQSRRFEEDLRVIRSTNEELNSALAEEREAHEATELLHKGELSANERIDAELKRNKRRLRKASATRGADEADDADEAPLDFAADLRKALVTGHRNYLYALALIAFFVAMQWLGALGEWLFPDAI